MGTGSIGGAAGGVAPLLVVSERVDGCDCDNGGDGDRERDGDLDGGGPG